MIKLICTLLLFMFASSGFSQVNMSPNILASPFQGEKFKMKSDMDVEGTPLLFDDWKSGEITLVTGESFKLDKLNFDASGLRFIYSKNDTLYELQSNVNKVKINNGNGPEDTTSVMLFRNDMLPGQPLFAQVLTKGKITILREFSKKPEGENYTNGVVTTSRKYVLHTMDVALTGGKTVPLKYSSAGLAELTSDKKNEVDSYVKANKLKPKNAEDFIKSINYYNSLN